MMGLTHCYKTAIFTFDVVRVLLFLLSILVFLARDAFARTNRRAIVMMFVRLSVRLRRAGIVIIRCMLTQI